MDEAQILQKRQQYRSRAIEVLRNSIDPTAQEIARKVESGSTSFAGILRDPTYAHMFADAETWFTEDDEDADTATSEQPGSTTAEAPNQQDGADEPLAEAPSMWGDDGLPPAVLGGDLP